MSTPIGNIVRSAKRQPGARLNVLTYATHERYQSAFEPCNADFYVYRGPGLKDWDGRFAPVPKNHTLLDPALGESQIPGELDLDVILAQSLEQYRVAYQQSQRLHVPMVLLFHVLPYAGMPEATRVAASKICGHITVTVSHYNKEQWGFPEGTRVIYHGLDTEFFKPEDASRPKSKKVLTVVNQIVSRNAECGYDIWRETTKNLEHRLVGDNPPLSSPAKSTEELRSIYQESLVFLNTTLVSSSPMSPLEAMACGCAVVSTSATTMPMVIQHGVNGFLSEKNDPTELAHYCQLLLDNPEMAREMGERARQTVIEKFSMTRFANEWYDVLAEAAGKTYVGPPL